MKKVICILGMHRSGTSCLVGCLQSAGLFLGDVYTQNPHNLKGNREHKSIQKLNDDVLVKNGGSWMEPPGSIIWSAEQIKQRNQIIQDFAGEAVWGFKDPRTLLLIDGWLEALPDMVFVGSLRHPLAVMNSLKKRNPTLRDDDFWLELWFQYNQKLLSLYKKNTFPIINFDHDARMYNKMLVRILQQLGLKKSVFAYLKSFEIANAAKIISYENEFFEKSLRHNRLDQNVKLPNHVADLYQELLDISL